MTEKFKETEIGLIPEDWEIKAFSEIVDIIGGGTPKTSVPEYWDGDIPWLSVVDFNNDFRTVDQTEKSISELGLKNSSTKILKKGDIIISARGTVGAIAQLGKDMAFNQSCYGLKAKNELTNNDFVYYLLKYSINNLKQTTHGSTFDTITTNTFDLIKVPFPPFNEQKAISEILSSIDSKIELNQKMNQTLEKIGQAIFKHWFIDFEFPDEDGSPYKSSGGEMVDSELGEVPEGWEVGTLNDLCDSITNGGTPKRKEEEYWNNGNIPWYKTGELFDGPLIDSEEHITEKGLKNSSCKLWEPNTVLMALYASPTVGRLGILKTPATSNQACSGLVAKNKIGYQYLFYTLLFKRDEFNSIAVGSAQQNISQDIVKNTKTFIPDSKITLEFQKIIEPLFEKRTLLLKESQNLSQIRDSLLPKLMSGKIRITNYQNKIEDRVKDEKRGKTIT